MSDHVPVEVAQIGNDSSTLITACQNGDIKTVKAFLEMDNFNDYDHVAMFMEASKHGHVGVIELLLDYGVHVDICDTSGKTALTIASQHGQAGIVKILLNHGAHVDENLLTQVSQSDCHEVLELLKKQLGMPM